ncbi:CBS domain-containing protein [Paenibacillus sp. sptzw28]|uniref:CBS domain-containing protein n=1 Tax=Paenibacillus sp. sptzw28 TaxID=715179 RepID=UPI001C6E7A70|nr:CBS domain-containing protein [Paenibacillus sp. sptzw28]QYR23680.1 CBS domain-containing protein [Paenibacillus sp. sptzw28]
MVKTIKDIMSTDCVTATTQDNIYELAVLMKQNDIGFVPIVEGKKLIGVVTDRDLVTRGYANKHSGSTSVSEVLTKEVKTVESSITVDDAAKLMATNQIRRLPVVENGELMGVVSIGDLAIREIFVNEAGDALSSISEHEHREPSALH